MFKKLEFEDEAHQGGEEQGQSGEPGPDSEEVKTICRAEDGGWTCRHAPELEGLRCMGIYLRKAGYRPSCLEDYKEAKKKGAIFEVRALDAMHYLQEIFHRNYDPRLPENAAAAQAFAERDGVDAIPHFSSGAVENLFAPERYIKIKEDADSAIHKLKAQDESAPFYGFDLELNLIPADEVSGYLTPYGTAGEAADFYIEFKKALSRLGLKFSSSTRYLCAVGP